MHEYSLYGLTVEADRLLPGLRSAFADAVDIDLSFERPGRAASLSGNGEEWLVSTSAHRDEAGRPMVTISRLSKPDGYRFLYADQTEFIIDLGGRRVVTTWPYEHTLEDVLAYLLGPILGFVLLLRGVPSLHASAVAFGDRAIAIAGPPGAGKSTIAAALALGGVGVLSDDLVALEEREEGFWAQPGYPRLRLWPDSVEGLLGSRDPLPRLTPGWDKRYLDLEARKMFHDEPARLGAIYVLDRSADARAAGMTSEMPPSEALMSLVANSYTFRLLDAEQRRRDFAAICRIAAEVPIRRLVPAFPLDDPERLGEAIAADLELALGECPRV